jgi:hypothetical protein
LFLEVNDILCHLIMRMLNPRLLSNMACYDVWRALSISPYTAAEKAAKKAAMTDEEKAAKKAKKEAMTTEEKEAKAGGLKTST